VKTEEVNSKEWDYRSFEFDCPGAKEDRRSFVLWPKSGEIDIDALYLSDKTE